MNGLIEGKNFETIQVCHIHKKKQPYSLAAFSYGYLFFGSYCNGLLMIQYSITPIAPKRMSTGKSPNTISTKPAASCSFVFFHVFNSLFSILGTTTY
jgi:hypothetical protein